MPAIHWMAVEPSTGLPIEELPGLRMQSTLPTIMGRSGGQVAVQLPIKDRLPDRWELATEPARTCLVAMFDDDQQTVAWAGTVIRRTRGSGPTIDLELTDVPGWLERTTRVPDLTFGTYDGEGNPTGPGVDQTTIARALGLDAAALAFHGQVAQIASGRLRHRKYEAAADKTRLSALQELSAVIDGPEWFIDWRWDSTGALVCVPTVADRVGRAAVGQQPETFSKVEWSIVEDYSEGRGATIVTGVAPNEGETRVVVTRQDDALLNAGYLPIEYRYQPDTGSVSESIITDYVTAKLGEVRLGTDTHSLSIPLPDLDIIPGRDVTIGDDVAVDLTNPDLPALDHTFTGRLIGWVLQPDSDTGQATALLPVLYKET